MQDVTDLAFMRVIAHYGAPDYFFTEFFRVHAHSRPEKHILRSIDENTTGRPVFAQLIGEDLGHLTRTVAELLRHRIAGIDLNLGCPAPKVYKKNVGGGLLRDPTRVGEILAALRAAVPGLFTVKMRLGFDDTAHFDRLLDLINEHRVDLLSVHGRTVKEMYRSEVHYDFIARAAARVRCPVFANGNITSAARAVSVLAETRAAGVMLGRHAIRNPWIFRQCREQFAITHGASAPVGRVIPNPPPPISAADRRVKDHTPYPPAIFRPALADVREYVERLYRATQAPGLPERDHVNKMKKYLNFVGQSVDATGAFLHDMRRAESELNLFAICDRHLLSEPTRAFSSEPYPGVIARPNCETPIVVADGCSLETITA
ncbi:MAG: tRNA-dihydrouridine synthase family protein [Opitutus sp.]|nr:tRNA-dihydrouridine synthase family protein [Opitutus sp.]